MDERIKLEHLQAPGLRRVLEALVAVQKELSAANDDDDPTFPGAAGLRCPANIMTEARAA